MGFWDKVKKTLVGDAPPEQETKPPKKEESGSSGADSAWGAAGQTAKASKPSGGGSGQYKAVVVEKGARGWGGPLVIQPEPGRELIYSVTGGGIHPVAQKIADLTGGKPFDGFNSKASFEEIACVVIDCGGTARVGVYPMKGIPTIDVYPASPSGPLAKHINEQNFVSGVKPETVKSQE
jgi:hypothetical protein